jgi:hypothetical protein
MWNQGETAQGVGPVKDAIEPVVFARGVWSVLMAGDVRGEQRPREGRALPDLLRQRWAIRATVATGDGTYFILTRRRVEELRLSLSLPASS